MSADFHSYHSAIQEHAASTGLAPTPDQIEAANALLNARLMTFSTGLTLVDGELHGFGDAVAHACSWFPKAPTPPAPPTPVTPPEPPSPPSPWTGQTAAAAVRVAQSKARDDADADAHARALANGRNPWRAGQINLTHQAIIRTRLPEVAARLKSQAEQ